MSKAVYTCERIISPIPSIAVDMCNAPNDSDASRSTTPTNSNTRSSALRFLELCLYAFFDTVEDPDWTTSLALFDSFARWVIPPEYDVNMRFSGLLLAFQANERPITEIQADMRYLLEQGPSELYEHFRGFLVLPLTSRGQREAARRYLCMLTGLPVEY